MNDCVTEKKNDHLYPSTEEKSEEKCFLRKKVLRKDNLRSKILNHFMNFIFK